jgi:hypothetical protein
VADHLDHHEHEHDHDRIVEPGLSLERALERLRQRHPAQQREHRRAVGGAEDRAQEQPLRQRDVQQPVGAYAGDERGRGGPDGRERHRRAEHRRQRPQPGLQAALEQDHEQRDGADEARERVVVEVDPAETVGADRHPDAQEQDERGQPQARGDQRRHHTHGEQPAADEDEMGVAGHAPWSLTQVGPGLDSTTLSPR